MDEVPADEVLAMRWSLCQCEVNGLVRPTNGPLRIKKTDVLEKDVLRATLAGPQGGTVHTVKVKGHFYYVGPNKDFREVPADTLTDALHAGVFIRNEELKKKKKIAFKKRPMPYVPVKKLKKV